jgi:hypothetical protein
MLRKRTVLLTEGSSLSARETITALGICGYRLEVCDPDPWCLGRFSGFVNRVHRCPAVGKDPAGYLEFTLKLLETGAYDVLLPVHEQAYLFAKASGRIPPGVGVALAGGSSFDRIQSKVAFAGLLDELEIPQPETRVCYDASGLLEPQPYPFFVKTAWGTASGGVFRVANAAGHAAIARQLESAGEFADGVVVQAAAPGVLERTQAVFSRGALAAIHAYRQVEEGVRGGDVRKLSVRRTEVREHVERLGKALDWHGALSLDYFWDEKVGVPRYIDANPRLVEPMNGVLSGVNLADSLVRISLGEALPGTAEGRSGVRTHLGIMALLSCARRTASRWSVFAEAAGCLLHRGSYAGSREELTPAREDPSSACAFAYAFTNLVANPASWDRLSGGSVGSYSLTPAAARFVRGMGGVQAEPGTMR